MSPSPRAALLLALAAIAALVVPVAVAAVAFAAVLGATTADALAARRVERAARRAPARLARGVPAEMTVEVDAPRARAVVVGQAVPPGIEVAPAEGAAPLQAVVVARRRGRHVLPAPGVRVDGPLGLGRWFHRVGDDAEVLVYPDLPAARRLATAVRQGRLGDAARRTRGPLGLGTDFESIRDYVPDDDVRLVNWRATVRTGRPMSNQYRVDRDREVLCVVDGGRLMAAPVGDRTRLDAALDAVVAVAAVADTLGDRCGALVVSSSVTRNVAPRRGGARAVVDAVFDVEPDPVDTDYELAFRTAERVKRALVVVFTDVVDEAAARGLVEAVPILARRHHVVVASVRDDDLEDAARAASGDRLAECAAVVARDVLDARRRALGEVRRAGAELVEASADALATMCVGAYLRAKARARA
ncbi:MAG TPA: DUF58 domain-containing protein [Actinomycetota bacterium]|nr:DUF58 domain-containing protein [Actinomycetota bacterium]